MTTTMVKTKSPAYVYTANRITVEKRTAFETTTQDLKTSDLITRRSPFASKAMWRSSYSSTPATRDSAVSTAEACPTSNLRERNQYSAIKIRKRNNGQNYDHLNAKACLFPDRNYGGQPFCFNSDNSRFANFGFDNKADSLRINGNYEVILYQHENYTGYSRIFRNNTPRFRDKDHDQFSSIRIRRRDEELSRN